jgi:hypothetical protein
MNKNTVLVQNTSGNVYNLADGRILLPPGSKEVNKAVWEEALRRSPMTASRVEKGLLVVHGESLADLPPAKAKALVVDTWDMGQLQAWTQDKRKSVAAAAQANLDALMSKRKEQQEQPKNLPTIPGEPTLEEQGVQRGRSVELGVEGVTMTIGDASTVTARG